MKSIYIFLVIVLLNTSAFGQAPEKMSYQALIRNSNNQLVTNSPVCMKISILQGTISGNAVYVEIQNQTTNSNGLVSLEIGDGSIVSGNFSDIDWTNGPYFIKAETDPNGGTNFSITGTSQLLSVPYALHSKTADNALGGDYNNLTNTPDLSGYLTEEVDGSTTNEIQSFSVSLTGDTLFLTNSNWVIIPGISTAQPSTTVTDFNNNVYQTVLIGNQLWMAENLRSRNYADGTPIPLVSDNSQWVQLENSDKAYCWYNNDSATYAQTYGALYNFTAATNGDETGVDVQGVCPDGWHLPDDDDWNTLEMALGMSPDDVEIEGWRGIDHGSQLAGNSELWPDGNLVENEDFGTSGFDALPGGYRLYTDGSYINEGTNGYWWSSKHPCDDEVCYNTVYFRRLSYNQANVYRESWSRAFGFSVRCVKNNGN